MLRKPIAVILAVIGAVATVNYVIGARYIDAIRDIDREEVLDPFMAAAVVVALIVHFAGKRELDAEDTDGPVTRRYLETNLAFYATVFLALWVFGDWIGAFVNSTLMVPLFVVMMGVTSIRLWRDSPGGESP